MRRLLLYFLALLVFPVILVADPKSEITVYSGWSFPGIDDTLKTCFLCPLTFDPTAPEFAQVETRKLGGSMMVGFKYSRSLNNKMAIEGNFGLAPNHKLEATSGIVCPPNEFICPLLGEPNPLTPVFFQQLKVVSYHYDVSFVYHFTTGQVKPYLLAGIGGISSDPEADLQTDFAWVFGAGSKFYVGKNTGLRFEVNDHLIPNHFLTDKKEHDVQIQYGFVFGL